MNTLTDAETQGPGAAAFNEHPAFFELNAWHHVAITFSHGYYTLYRDGASIFSKQGLWSEGAITVLLLNQNAYFDEIYFVASELLPSDIATLYASNSLCGPCGANGYCAGGASFSCPVGAVSPPASTSVSACACAAGFYSVSGVCVQCPAGRFCSGGSVSASSSSGQCPAGSYCLAGVTSPVPCSTTDGEWVVFVFCSCHSMVCCRCIDHHTMLWFVFIPSIPSEHLCRILIHPLPTPQAPTAQLVRLLPTYAPPATTARRRHPTRSLALREDSAPAARSPPGPVPAAPTPPPPSKPRSPPASPARRARWGRSRARSATPPRTACAPTARTSRSGPRSLRPMPRAPGCATAGTTGIRARRARPVSGASRGSPTAVLRIVLRRRCRLPRTRACATPATPRRAPPRVPAPAPCARPGLFAQDQESYRWRSRPRPSPTSPPSSCSCSSRCRWPTIWYPCS